jgi:hypothetical protein
MLRVVGAAVALVVFTPQHTAAERREWIHGWPYFRAGRPYVTIRCVAVTIPGFFGAVDGKVEVTRTAEKIL